MSRISVGGFRVSRPGSRKQMTNDWIKETEVTHAKPKPYTLNPKLVNDWIGFRLFNA